MANIKFGTDGWRAIVGDDFTSENVEIVTNAIAKYIFDNFGLEKKVIIGYDPRNMALEFSTQAAKILANVGFEVLLSKEVIPTPALAYNAQILNACAIMFTASHNPPEYLGMKFIPDYAGPATSAITDEIVSNFDKNIVKNGPTKFPILLTIEARNNTYMLIGNPLYGLKQLLILFIFTPTHLVELFFVYIKYPYFQIVHYYKFKEF